MGQFPHGRLESGYQTCFAAVFIPGLEGHADRQDQVGQCSGFIHEVAETDDKEIRPFKGFLHGTIG